MSSLERPQDRFDGILCYSRSVGGQEVSLMERHVLAFLGQGQVKGSNAINRRVGPYLEQDPARANALEIHP